MKNHKIPEISILRASNGAFDGILIDPDASSLAASAIDSDSAPAASANDCTGISVTVPQTHDEAEALTKVEPVPQTSVDSAKNNFRPDIRGK